MRIVHVVTIKQNVVHSIKSFVIYTEKQLQKIVQKAEKEFKRVARELGAAEEDMEEMNK